MVKKLISKQKKDRSDEEYLSFSESSDEYDYYVYKVKKARPEKKKSPKSQSQSNRFKGPLHLINEETNTKFSNDSYKIKNFQKGS